MDIFRLNCYDKRVFFGILKIISGGVRVMTEFVNMWKNFINFSDRTTRRGYWMAFLFVVIFAVVISIIAVATGLEFLSWIFSAAIFIPSLSMQVRRLRDAGRFWLWIFVPIVGFIFLFMPSVPDDGVPVV